MHDNRDYLNTSPLHYTLKFEPLFKNFTFNGIESILIRVTKPTNKIVMHAADLSIKSCHITHNNNDQKIKAKTNLNQKKELLTITLPQKLKGTLTLHLTFTGILNDRLLGFYRSQYKLGGKTKFMATTQFEAADARRAFPCWDEPDKKATFDITLIAPNPNYTAISNMPVTSKTRLQNNKVQYKFDTTPIMSTYLIYLGVGEFESISTKSNNDITIRVITTSGNKSRAKFSLNIAKKLLTSFEKYFGISYPLPKLDLLAIPDFAAGAMENWGAITFRETILLYDPQTSSTRTKQFIAEVISHEIAHQWFGNLVTMKWWNDLWLNESFATFMATKFVDHFYPEWDLWDQFLEDTMNTAMSLDSLKTTHPIDVCVNSPAEIREIFDAISYDKGGCILRMLEMYVGEPNFRRGLKKYLVKFKYKNAVGNDLWDAIGSASGKPVKSMINSWLAQPGFPLVYATQDGSRVCLKQKRFLLEPPPPSKSTLRTSKTARQSNKKNSDIPPNSPTITPVSSQLWQIPIDAQSTFPTITPTTTTTKKETIPKTNKLQTSLLKTTSKTIKIPKNSSVIINSNRTGFYRTYYDDGILLDLKMLVHTKKIGHIDRWSIQNDLFALCVAGMQTVKNYLDFCDAYFNEDNYLVSVNVAHNLFSLYLLTFPNNPSSHSNKKATMAIATNTEIKNYALKYFGHLLNNLGWTPKKGDKHTDALLRSFVISALAKLGDTSVISTAQTKFAQFLKKPDSLSPDLRETIFSIIAWSNNDTKTHTKLTALYKKANTQEEKLWYLGALCNFKNPNLLIKTLNFSQTPHVRSQNMQLPIMRVAANPFGKQVLWPWLAKNWKKLSSKIGSGNPLFNRIVSSIGQVVDDTMEKEIRLFFKQNPTPGTARTLEQTLERVRIRSKFADSIYREFYL